MHSSKEFLMEAVGLSLLVALILISTQIFQRSVKITSILEDRQEKKIAELEEYEIVQYDGLAMDGITAMNYIRRMINSYEMPVQITTAQATFYISDSSEYEELRNTGSEKYINPLEKYRCEVIRNENRSITEIKIQIEKEGN